MMARTGQEDGEAYGSYRFDDRFYVGPDDEPDRYEIIYTLGGGGEGTVSKAQFLLEGTWQVVAVKTLLPDRIEQLDDWAGRWRSQVDLLRLLADPGVVGVHDGFIGPVAHRAGQAEGRLRTLHLVMNWVEGSNLVKWRDEIGGTAAFHEVAKVLNQVAISLDYLASGRDTNGQPAVHGDVKPANVIVTGTSQTRLVDFGLARLAHATTSAPSGYTKGYLAPETAATGQFSPASDRYALGAVAYFLFTGEDPPVFYDLETMQVRLNTSPLLDGREAMSAHVISMLTADPAQRPSSAAAWARQFGLSSSTVDRVIDTTLTGGVGWAVGGDGYATSGLPSGLARTAKSAGFWAAALAALALLAAAAVFALTRDKNAQVATNAASTTTSTRLAITSIGSISSTTSTVTTTTTRLETTTSTTTTTAAPIRTTYLSELRPVKGGWDSDNTGAIPIDGTVYPNSMSQYDCFGNDGPYNFQFNLGRKYGSFESIIGMSDFTDTGWVSQVEFRVDGAIAATAETRVGQPTSVNFPVADALVLDITITTLAGGGCGYFDPTGPTLGSPRLLS